jgi:lysophospholipase L1-like esterase
MGDSFAAANGIENEGRPCYNGKGAWPYQVGASLTLTNPNVVSVACSGATTAGILGTEKTGIPPQIDALKSVSQLDDALITITIGGNDVDVSTLLVGCVNVGNSCATPDTEAQVKTKIDEVRGSLVRTYKALRNAAPKATIVAVGYPNLVLGDPLAKCTDGKNFDLDADERAMMRRMVEYMNTVIAKAAADESINSITLEVQQHFEGYEMCLSPTAGYFHFLNDNASLEGQFHPNRAGIAAYAAAVLKGLPKLTTRIGTVMEPGNTPVPELPTEPEQYPEQVPTEPEYPEQVPPEPEQYPEQVPTEPEYPEQYPEQGPTEPEYPEQYPEQEPTEPEYPEQYPEQEPTEPEYPEEYPEQYPEQEPTEPEYPEQEYPEEQEEPYPFP